MNTQSPDMIFEVLEKYPILELVQIARRSGWTDVWQQFNDLYE